MPEGPVPDGIRTGKGLALDAYAQKVLSGDICGRRAVPFLPAML